MEYRSPRTLSREPSYVRDPLSRDSSLTRDIDYKYQTNSSTAGRYSSDPRQPLTTPTAPRRDPIGGSSNLTYYGSNPASGSGSRPGHDDYRTSVKPRDDIKREADIYSSRGSAIPGYKTETGYPARPSDITPRAVPRAAPSPLTPRSAAAANQKLGHSDRYMTDRSGLTGGVASKDLYDRYNRSGSDYTDGYVTRRDQPVGKLDDRGRSLTPTNGRSAVDGHLTKPIAAPRRDVYADRKSPTSGKSALDGYMDGYTRSGDDYKSYKVGGLRVEEKGSSYLRKGELDASDYKRRSPSTEDYRLKNDYLSRETAASGSYESRSYEARLRELEEKERLLENKNYKDDKYHTGKTVTPRYNGDKNGVDEKYRIGKTTDPRYSDAVLEKNKRNAVGGDTRYRNSYLEDSIDRKSVTWGENSFHHLDHDPRSRTSDHRSGTSPRGTNGEGVRRGGETDRRGEVILGGGRRSPLEGGGGRRGSVEDYDLRRSPRERGERGERGRGGEYSPPRSPRSRDFVDGDVEEEGRGGRRGGGMRRGRWERSVRANVSAARYQIVSDVVHLLGMSIARPQDPPTACSLIWNDSYVSMEKISGLESHQRINHFPGLTEIGNTDRLVKNFNKMASHQAADYGYFPRSWVLPDDATKFNSACKQAKNKNKKKFFIVKPANSKNKNKEIQLVSSDEHTGEVTLATVEGERVIIQEYIDRPILVNKHKCHVRLYAVITSCHPLQIFVYSDGLVQLARHKYAEPDDRNLDDIDSHVTSSHDEGGGARGEEEGLKFTLRKLMEFLRSSGKDVDRLWSQINEVIVKTVFLAHPAIYRAYNMCRLDGSLGGAAARGSGGRTTGGSVCFEVLAFDLLIDKEMKPWLIQVNRSPSFTLSDDVDAEIKPGVIEDALRLVDIRGPSTRKELNVEAELQTLNKLDQMTSLSSSSSSSKDKKTTSGDSNDKKEVIKEIIGAIYSEHRAHTFSEGAGKFKQIFPPRDKASLEHYCRLLEVAHTHLSISGGMDGGEGGDGSTEAEIQQFLLQKKRDRVNALIRDEANKENNSNNKTTTKPNKIELSDEVTMRTLKALNNARISFPGKTEKSTEYLLDKITDHWKENKPKVAEYWFISLDSVKQQKVMDIVREKVREIALRTWSLVSLERVTLYRLFERLFNRLLANHGQGLWDCFDQKRKRSSWEVIFSKSTDAVTPTELACCRRIVQLSTDCLLIAYKCAADRKILVNTPQPPTTNVN